MAQLPPDICFLCLSRDRKIFRLSANIRIRQLFGFLTDWYPQTDARVCWECRAMLERLRRFKEQAERSVCALKRARTGLQPMSFECLSKVYCTQILFIDLLENDDASDYSVDISENKICNINKVEVEFEDAKPKIKNEIELDLGAYALYGDVPDPIAEDDEVETKCFETIDLTEDNTDYAIKYDTEEISFPLTNLPITTPSSSEEEESTLSKSLENSWALKKTHGVVKTTIKPKNPIELRTKRNLTTAEQLIKKERRAEEQKYRLYQQGKAFECDHCDKKYEMRSQILRHMKVHFTKIMCEQCGYRCNRLGNLRKHMLAHLDPSHRPYECEVCHNRFIEKYKLLVHTRSHTGERPFKCDNCGMVFTYKEAMTCHIKKRHTDRGTLAKKRSSQPRTKSFYINTRQKKWYTKQRKHYTASRDKKNFKIMMSDKSITYECNVCKEIFAHLNIFLEHYNFAHKTITCAECNKTFKFKSQLTHHVNIVHRGEKPYQCNICGARSTTKSLLQRHMASHSNEKPFKCDQCSVKFKYKCGLYTHKMIHTGEKPHQCDICEARFTLKGNLTGHMKMHTNDRPFECDICSKKFPWKRNLKNHLKTHSMVD